jgi:muramoyltetrapeptide carboxypeptidase LdcA involved in peptidoglycan recycling
MEKLIKPRKLQKGDTIATISISGGRAGDVDMLERYEIGKSRLKEIFGLNVIETPNAMKGSEYLYKYPKARVEDLMWALCNTKVKGVITNMGGDDSYRLLPYINYDIIRNNPKVMMGFSDISTLHNIFTYAGVSSFYGPSLLTPIAQPGKLDEYTKHWMNRVLFSSNVIGEIEPCKAWTYINWENNDEKVQWTNNTGYKVINGRGKVQGRLLGGCCGPLQQIMGTKIFPSTEQWKDSIIFLEIGIPYSDEISGLHQVRAFAATGMFRQAKGLICTNLRDEEEAQLVKVICEEEGLVDFPILANLDFGHRTPMMVIPIGTLAELDCDNARFTILESAVID